MKILLIFLFSLIYLGITSPSYSEYTKVKPDTEIPQVLLQLILRDAHGNLVTYIETNQVYTIDTLEFHKFLENQSQKRVVNQKGIAYEIIQWEGERLKFNEKAAESQFALWVPGQDGFQKILLLGHNSYQTKPGDTLTAFWTVIRPLN